MYQMYVNIFMIVFINEILKVEHKFLTFKARNYDLEQ